MGGVGKQHELTHYLVIVHATFQAFKLLLEALFMQVKCSLIVILVLSYDAEVQVNLGDYSFIYSIACLVYFLDQPQALLKVVLRSLQIAHLQVTIPQLVANIDEKNRFIEDHFRLYLSLDALELLYSLCQSITIHETFSQASSRLDVVINPEL